MRVALPTVGTNVCLNVLRLLMLGYVVEQGLLVSKTFIAGVTLVGLVRLMTPRVRLQVGQLGEGLGAAWNRKRLVRKGSVGFLIAEQSSRRFSSQSVDKVQLVVREVAARASLGRLERRKTVCHFTNKYFFQPPSFL